MSCFWSRSFQKQEEHLKIRRVQTLPFSLFQWVSHHYASMDKSPRVEFIHFKFLEKPARCREHHTFNFDFANVLKIFHMYIARINKV